MREPADWHERWGDAVRRYLRTTGLSVPEERELIEELSRHLDDVFEDLIGRGMAEDEAIRRTLEELREADDDGGSAGESPSVNAAPTRVASISKWPSFAADLRFAVRLFRHQPAFSGAAVLTIALGIGATTAMFSLVHGLLLRPLPYPDASLLGTAVGIGMFTPENLDEWRSASPSIERLSGFGLASGILEEPGQTRRLTVLTAESVLLAQLGARPLRGRLWSEEEAEAGAAPVALVSERLWREVMGEAEPTTRALNVDGRALEVLGVLPADFHNLGYTTDLWVPLAQWQVPTLTAVVRLRPGATFADAERELQAIAPHVAAAPIADRFGRSVRVGSLRELFTGEVRSPLLLLFAAAGCVLLLACVNLANLLMSRASARGREMAVRMALGARRAVLLRQLLVENAILGLAGAAAGLLLSVGVLEGITAVLPPHYSRLPAESVRPSATVLGISVLATLFTTGVAGLAPAFAGLRAAHHVARSSAATPARAARLWRDGIIIGEVAIALMLLAGTTLLVRSYLAIRPAAPGYELTQRYALALTLGEDRARNVELIRRLTREVEVAFPGSRAAAANTVPLSGMAALFPILAVDGSPIEAVPGQRPPMLDLNATTPDYMEVLGIELEAGRMIAESDVEGAPAVVVVSRTAARRLWADLADPIGHRVTVDLPDGPAEFVVAGVVADIRTSGINTSARPQGLISYWQTPRASMHIIFHVPRSVRPDAAILRSLVARVDPGVPVGDLVRLETLAARSVATPRYHMTVMSGFAVLAMLLTVVGCYGVLAYSVSQRMREFGVRLALGASPRAILGGVVARAAALIGTGVILGTAMALGGARLLENSLYGTRPADAPTLLLAAFSVVLVALPSVAIPAVRAARADPVTALRAE